MKEKAKQTKSESKTLDYSATPDEIKVVALDVRQCACGQDLAGLVGHYERIQVYDLPELHLKVREYKRERKRCSCGHLHEAVLPAGVVRGVQYGSRVKGLLSYLHQYQQLPMKRCCEVLADCFGQAISQKSLGRFQEQLYHRLGPAEAHIKAQLQQAEVLHSDETGMFIASENHWLHVRSNDRLSYYHIDKSRGIKAHHKMGLLAEHQGYLVHDCYSSYFKHQAKHVICHAHSIRELLALHEQDQTQVWAYNLAKHLVAVQHQRLETPLSPTEQVAQQRTYRNLLLEGLLLNPASPPPDKPRKGKRKNSLAHNLIMRLLTHADAATRFMRDTSVPFTNNQAERDLRMAKLKQKISGGFRTTQGARAYARIRAYISTARKQAQPILKTLTQVFDHNVWLPAP